MAEPWKDFQSGSSASSAGPWNDFAPSTPASPAAAPPAPAPKKSSVLRRVVGDSLVDLARGGIGVGEAAAGLANITSFGGAGRALDAVGFDPKLSKDMIGELYSPERKAAQEQVDQAKGFVGTAQAMLKNPSTIAGTVVESVPAMLAGGAVGRALGAVGSGLSAVGRAAIGEGAVGAGMSAESIRQQDEDGTLGPGQIAAAIGSGVGTAAFGAAGGALARRLGIADADVIAAGGPAVPTLQRPTGNIVSRAVRGAAAGAVSEGVLEELPQSVQEQAWQNVALGRPLLEGVPESAAAGMLAGAAMGGPVGAVSGAAARPAPDSMAAAAEETPAGAPAAGPTLALPAPDGTPSYGTIAVTPDGIAIHREPGVFDGAGAPVTRVVGSSKGMVDTGSVRAPALRYPAAAPGSMAAAANALPEAATALPRAGANEGMFERIQAEQKRDAARGGLPRGDEAGNAAYEERDVAVGDDEFAPSPPANLDPETGELLGIDAERWPAAAEHQQPAAIVRALKAQAAQNKNRLAPMSQVAKTFNVSADTARALRKQALSEMQAEAESARQINAGVRAGEDVPVPAAAAAPSAEDAAPAAPAAQASAPAGPEAAANREAAGAQVLAQGERGAEDTPGAAHAAVYDEAEELLDTDIGAPSGGPFTIRDAAERAATRTEGGRVFPVEGGFVVRTPRSAAEALPDRAPEPEQHQRSPAARTTPSTAGIAPESNGQTPLLPSGTSRPDAGLGQAAAAPTGIRPQEQQSVAASAGGKDSLPSSQSTQIDAAVPEGEQAAAIADRPEAGAVAPATSPAASQSLRQPEQVQPASGEVGEGPVDRDAPPAPAQTTPAPPAEQIAARANEAATSPANDLPEPSAAQKDAGNYRKGHVRLNGHDISIENPAGSKRDPKWPAIKDHYGYIRGTVGKDKDHVDVFMTDRAHEPELPVFVVDQVNKDGSFDEHKVVMGAADEAGARATYLRNYSKGWTGLGAITQMTQDEFKAWVRDPKRTRRPAGKLTKAAPEVDEAAKSVDTNARSVDTPRPKVRTVKGSKRYQEGHPHTIRAFFQPGALVPSYGGTDRVLGLDMDESGAWSARVIAVNPDGSEIAGERERRHSTVPEHRDIVKVLGKAKDQPPTRRATKKAASPAQGRSEPSPAEPRPQSVDEAPNGVRVGDRVTVADDRRGPYEATVTAIEINAAPAYNGTAFKVARDDATPDGRGTGWVGIDKVSPVSRPDASAATQTDDAGGTPTLMSKSGEDANGGALTLDRALQLKAELTGKWGENAPTVILVESAEDFPASAKVDPDYRRAEGLWDGKNTVWINVEGIATEKRFAEVLAHEAIGHFGFEAVVGKDWPGIVSLIARHRREGTGAPSVQRAIRSVTQRYGQLDPETFAKEVVAVMAEQGAKNGLLARVVAAVRRWLRQHMPGLQWTDADVLGLLASADSFLRAGRSQAQSREMVAAMAFSQQRQALSEFLRGEPVASVDAGAFARQEGTTLREQVEQFFAGLGNEAVSPQLGPIALRSGGVKSSMAHGLGRAKAAAFRLVPDVIERGRVVDESIDETGRTAERRVIGAPVRVGGEDYLMGVVVRQARNQPAAFYLHEVTLTPKGPRSPIKNGPESAEAPAEHVGATGAIGKILLDAFDGNRDTRFSQPPVQVEMDGRGDRRIRMGGETFREVGQRFYMVNGTGWPKDFASLGAATEAAQRTGGEVLADAPVEGERPSWSVVVPEVAARDAGAGRPLFSKAPADVLADIDAVMSDSHREGFLPRVKQWLKDATPKKIKDELRGSWLGALTTRHLTELGQDYFENIRHYSDFLAAQQADRNKLASDAEGIAEGARKWAGKNRAEARRLFDLMHQATIDGIDPAEDHQPLQFHYGGVLREATQKNVKDALRAIREQMLGRSADNKKDMMAEAKRLREMPAREKRRRAKRPGLVERWQQLSPEAQAIYRQFRDAYAERSDAIEQALVDRINDTDAPENHKRKLINTIRQQFETQRLQGVYFPLQRFGRYFAAAEKDGANTFLMFERLSDLERSVKDLKQRGFTITAQGLKSAGKAKDAPSGTFVAEVIEQMRKAGVSNETQDQIYQIYLQSLPELSMRKHSIHRKVVPGFDPDAVRGFAFNMHHGAHQLARLRYGHKMQNVLDLLKRQQDAARREPDADTRRIAAGDAILEELNKRDEWINNPQDSSLTNLVSSFGFTYYLGLTPAAALVNLTQTAMVSYPYLAARYGHAKAMNALLKGMAAAGRTIGNIQNTLTDPEERQAHAVLQRMGAIEKTQAHNLAGIAEGGLAGYNPKWAKAMEIVGWGFHKTEVVNREATGMAAFRLARAAGESFEQAIKVAADTIYDTHFDYSNANRARFMQSGTAKVLLMFRQYSLNMTWHLARMVWQASKGQDKATRALARRNLAGVLGMAGVFAGVLGLPLVKATMGVLNAVAASAGDDDEPWDAETEFRAWLAELLGPEVAELVLTGPANALTGADVHSRVSLSELWFRDADRELDGRGQYYHLLEQAAGPMGGVLKNALVGKGMIDEGHVWRGVETMLPKGLKDMLKAGRYATQGVNNLRGDPLVADPSLWQNLLQLGGFTPAEVSRQYDTNRALKNYEQHILDRRQHLMNALAMAYRLEDQESRAETMQQIQAFNRTHPEIGITPAAIRRSIQSRARYSSKAEAGIVLNPKIAAKVRAQVGVGQ